MKNLDMEKVFGVFRDEGLSLVAEESRKSTNIDGAVHLASVIASIESYYLLDQAYLKSFSDVYGDVRDRVRVKIYDKIFLLLSSITINDYTPFVSVVRELSFDRINKALSNLIEHFIELEEYEKCSKIKKVLDIVEFLNLSVGTLPKEKKVEL